MWPMATTTPASTSRRVTSNAPGSSGASVTRVTPPSRLHSCTRSSEGRRSSSAGWAPRRVALSIGPSRWRPPGCAAGEARRRPREQGGPGPVDHVGRCRHDGRQEAGDAVAGEQGRELPQPFGLVGEIDAVAAVHLQVPEPRRHQQAPRRRGPARRPGCPRGARPRSTRPLAHDDVGRYDAVVTDDEAAQHGHAHVPTPAASPASRVLPPALAGEQGRAERSDGLAARHEAHPLTEVERRQQRAALGLAGQAGPNGSQQGRPHLGHAAAQHHHPWIDGHDQQEHRGGQVVTEIVERGDGFRLAAACRRDQRRGGAGPGQRRAMAVPEATVSRQPCWPHSQIGPPATTGR